MTSDASPPRPSKRQRTSKELKLVEDRAHANGISEPPIPYVRRSFISPVRPTPSDRTPIAGAKTTILSRRYRDKCGEPIYTVRIEYTGLDERIEEREVGMDDIDDYVSKAELERFELTWFDPDEVMPGIAIGAAGFERTQIWETPSSTGEGDERSRSASLSTSSKAKKAPTRAFVDMLPPARRRGRPPKKTAAIMGVGPAKDSLDGGARSGNEKAYDFDADIKDGIDPANVRGTATTGTRIGGYVLIPARSQSAVLSQQKAVAAEESRSKKCPTPTSSASASHEPEDLLPGFNPRPGKTRQTPSSTTSNPPARRPGGRGRPPKSATARKSMGSLLAYVESDEFVQDSRTSKSPCPEIPAHGFETNTPAEKVTGNGEGRAQSDPTHQHEGHDDRPSISRPQPACQSKASIRPPIEVIELSSSSESEAEAQDPFTPTVQQRQDPRHQEAVTRMVAHSMAIEKARENFAKAPRPRTPTPQRSPTPGPAELVPAREARAPLVLVPSLPPGASAENAICLDDDDDEEVPFDADRPYTFSKVIDSKIIDGKRHYLIQWNEDPCPPPEWSWYAEKELGQHAYRMVEQLIEDKLRRPSSPATMARDQERLSRLKTR